MCAHFSYRYHNGFCPDTEGQLDLVPPSITIKLRLTCWYVPTHTPAPAPNPNPCIATQLLLTCWFVPYPNPALNLNPNSYIRAKLR